VLNKNADVESEDNNSMARRRSHIWAAKEGQEAVAKLLIVSVLLDSKKEECERKWKPKLPNPASFPGYPQWNVVRFSKILGVSLDPIIRDELRRYHKTRNMSWFLWARDTKKARTNVHNLLRHEQRPTLLPANRCYYCPELSEVSYLKLGRRIVIKQFILSIAEYDERDTTL
jgi:hypothetical protein